MARKDLLLSEQKVTEASTVDQATFWADALVRREHRGPGDTVDAARARAARRYRLPERLLWALRYRRPKDVLASVYVALQRAYEAECERQEARLEHEIELAKALTPSPALAARIGAAEAVLRASRGEETRAAAQPAGTDGAET